MTEHRPVALLRRQRGALAVEAAFVLPVIIAGAMMVMELANMGLTIDMGGTALDRAVQQFRTDDASLLQPALMEPLLRERMAAAAHGRLSQDNIATIDIERFPSLDVMGGGIADPNDAPATRTPVWRITVDIRKDFITPLPRLLSIDSGAFRYRYQQVLGHLPPDAE